MESSTATAVLLWWIPVGAGGHVVRRTSRWWELGHALIARRAPQPLFHAALEATIDGARYVIEMAPAWGRPEGSAQGVARTGPVGLRALGRSRLFRYEVRRWRDGTIPDLRWAEGGPTTLTDDAAIGRRFLELVDEVPTLTWGRAVGTAGAMWNSNSLVSWLMVRAGLDAASVAPPEGGSAPGWQAGIDIAHGGDVR